MEAQSICRWGGGLLCLLLGACGGSAEPSSSRAPSRDLYEALGGVQENYQPLSAEAMVAESDVIAIVRIVDAKDGSIYDVPSPPSHPLYTVVFEAEIEEMVMGSKEAERLYIEFYRGARDKIESFDADLPSDRMMVFLSDARQGLLGAETQITDQGRPSGSRVYMLRTPQGFIIEGADGLVQPLEPEQPGLLLFPNATSIEQVRDRVADLSGSN